MTVTQGPTKRDPRANQAVTSSARSGLIFSPGLIATGSGLFGCTRKSQSARMQSFKGLQTQSVVHHASAVAKAIVGSRAIARLGGATREFGPPKPSKICSHRLIRSH
jgi:hypothetical protein